MIGKNNPFNIRYSGSNKWIGCEGQTRGFCNFSQVYYCIRAAAILVMRSYRMKDCLNIQEIINRWAPPSENKTDKYVDFICARLGVFPFDIPKDFDEYVSLLYWISVFEGNPVPRLDIRVVIMECNIKPYVRRKKHF